jgi:hypothetical protein
MQMSSTLQILTVETTDSKTVDTVTGKPFQRVAARCILLGDAGEVVTVGRLRVPKSLQAQVKPGTFRAAFALKVPDFGDNKGDIVAELTSLLEVAKANTPSQATSPKA